MRRKAGICLIVALAGFSHAVAQTTTDIVESVGIEGSIQRGWGLGEFPVFGTDGACGLYGSDGPHAGNAFSIDALATTSPLFHSPFGAMLGIGWETTTEIFSSTPPDRQLIFDPASLETVQLDRHYLLTARSRSVHLDLGARGPIGDGMSITAGIRLGYRYALDITQRAVVEGPEAFRDEEGVALSGANDLTLRPLLAGATAGFSWSTAITPAFSVQPSFRLRYDLLSPVREAGWQRLSFAGSLAFLLNTATEPEPAVQPTDLVGTPPAAPLPRLSASIDLHGVGSDGVPTESVAISVREIALYSSNSLLASLFFDSSAAEIPTRYRQLTRRQAEQATLDSFVAGTPLDLNHQILNVIGSRMRLDTSAVLTIVAKAATGETAATREARERNVGNYLREIWAIDERRLRMEARSEESTTSGSSTREALAESRAVELRSTSPGITAPVLSLRIVREFDPPAVVVRPTIVADAGVRRWSISITNGGKEVAHYSSNTGDSSRNRPITWGIISERMESSLQPLVARIDVEDSAGTHVVAHDRLDLLLAPAERVTGGIDTGKEQRRVHTLTGFDVNVAELKKQDREELRRILPTITEGSRITVQGYADRTGSERFNVQLSDARARTVAAELESILKSAGRRNVTIIAEGKGEAASRYPAELPEGRILSRGAVVVIESGNVGSGER